VSPSPVLRIFQRDPGKTTSNSKKTAPCVPIFSVLLPRGFLETSFCYGFILDIFSCSDVCSPTPRTDQFFVLWKLPALNDLCSFTRSLTWWTTLTRILFLSSTFSRLFLAILGIELGPPLASCLFPATRNPVYLLFSWLFLSGTFHCLVPHFNVPRFSFCRRGYADSQPVF